MKKEIIRWTACIAVGVLMVEGLQWCAKRQGAKSSVVADMPADLGTVLATTGNNVIAEAVTMDPPAGVLTFEQPSLREAIKPKVNAVPVEEKSPKTRLAPDGVNTITELDDGIVSMTLVHVPRSDITAVARLPHHYITQAEAEEVMVIIRDSLNAHHFALEFYETALKTMKEPAEYARVRDNIDRVMVNIRRLIEFEAKWRARVEEGKK